ncbi:hypothetical protein GH714_036171 [Hevea brasiliensis]|uniref:PPM-type phosphatase domain-containing protein n=1 Tax=Hevea brasiliensis TaxID=3981 RepID=A0A6A6L750_HEVBR|nr:hypothetical protein GH714_036171 [Hevea brasiliensis]
MAGICCEVVAESEAAAVVEPSSRVSRRRRLELRPFKVAMKCKDRLHEIMKEEIERFDEVKCVEWKEAMARSYAKMDNELEEWCNKGDKNTNCRCELQTPQCDAVGSTAVVAVVTPNKIVVSNCGDSRAVLCRNGELSPFFRSQGLCFCVARELTGPSLLAKGWCHSKDKTLIDRMNWLESKPLWPGNLLDGARVLGVLAMSRAIGDNYLKPYRQKRPSPPGLPGGESVVGSGTGESSDKVCSDASMLLTKLALARHSTDNVSVIVVDLRRNQQS